MILLEEAVFCLSTELQWHHWTKEDLEALILAIVDKREKLAHTLATAFYTFDPVSQSVHFEMLPNTVFTILLKDISTSCQMTFWIKLYME